MVRRRKAQLSVGLGVLVLVITGLAAKPLCAPWMQDRIVNAAQWVAIVVPAVFFLFGFCPLAFDVLSALAVRLGYEEKFKGVGFDQGESDVPMTKNQVWLIAYPVSVVLAAVGLNYWIQALGCSVTYIKMPGPPAA